MLLQIHQQHRWSAVTVWAVSEVLHGCKASRLQCPGLQRIWQLCSQMYCIMYCSCRKHIAASTRDLGDLCAIRDDLQQRLRSMQEDQGNDGHVVLQQVKKLQVS